MATKPYIYLLVFLLGCSVPAQKGGKGVITKDAATIGQPENPATAAEQSRAVSNVVEVLLPAGGILRGPETNNVTGITLPPGTVYRSISTETTGQLIGAAQKDVSREIAAKLQATRPVMWVGIALLLFGVAMFHPVVFAVTGGSRSVQVLSMAVGGLMIIAPSLLAGNERLILFAGLGLVVAYWWVHRYGEKDGKLKALGLVDTE